MSINRTPEAPASAREHGAGERSASERSVRRRRARHRPARLVWVLGLAVGIIGGAIVAYGLAEVTAGAASMQAHG